MIQRKFSPIFAALALSYAASAGHSQSGYIGSQPAPDPNNVTTAAQAVQAQRPSAVSSAPTAAHRGRDRDRDDRDYGRDRDRHDGYGNAPRHHHSPVRGTRGNVTVIIGNNSYPSYASPYPYYPPYGYQQSYGSSVTISTPGFQSQNFTMFPYSTTVTTWGTRPGYPAYPTYYPPAVNYPAYPTYVPSPHTHGYRGAAGGGTHYNGGTFIGGGHTTTYPGTVGIPPLNFSNGTRR